MRRRCQSSWTPGLWLVSGVIGVSSGADSLGSSYKGDSNLGALSWPCHDRGLGSFACDLELVADCLLH